MDVERHTHDATGVAATRATPRSVGVNTFPMSRTLFVFGYLSV